MAEPSARELDDALLRAVHAWRGGDEGAMDEAAFEAHAFALLAHQLERNEPYRRFVATLGAAARAPASWRALPAVPASAFKDATLATFDPHGAELVFETSGTTSQQSGVHYVERAALYDASLLAGFERSMLPDRPKLRYLNVVPNPRLRPRSSLGYMMGHVSVLRGEGAAGFFLGDDGVDVRGFTAALRAAERAAQPVLIAGTAFGLATLLDGLEAARERFAAPAGSRLMETGGFKGRARVVARPELYERLAATLGIAQDRIVAEYGMTELLTQYYDAHDSRGAGERVKVAPPWLRSVAVDAEGRPLRDGERGYLRHVDLANRSSVLAIDTEDVGRIAQAPDGTRGLVLEGRAPDAPPRGCSLDAEGLAARTTAAPAAARA